ncbi:MAG: tRNA (adenosine(37)-N6)-threonylcarbamoyltransferase complex transferase subunit TsaD [Alphaproteobacteria bacterium]|jgi:N6-L-threonylcarbamoyladenine synthase|nr:tRNA (adenosine(37)-N6)-threonylcarbamoyltransferase complex transferase subunit TsaD [Alphaproteobacteria bacterium]
MKILGIESSCDETAVAIVNEKGEVLSHQLISQTEHLEYGGVVPEIASRAHVDAIDSLFNKALDEANCKIEDLDAISATTGPGLVGGLIVGTTFAQAIAGFSNKPFISVNHLQAHGLMARMGTDLQFPYILLLVSGGHTQILLVKDVDDFELIGESIDDAAGECFDKVAKIMDLPYPGGPKIDKLSGEGDSNKYTLPKPLIKEPNCNFSFSGLKSASLRLVNDLQPIDETKKADISAVFQKTVCEIVDVKIRRALDEVKSRGINPTSLVVSGGVGANSGVRKTLQNISEESDIDFIAPPIKLCMDNGVMIAWTGLELFRKGKTSPLDIVPNPRWQLKDL